MSFDDLAFPGGIGGHQRLVAKMCRACEETRQMHADEWTCPACGERMTLADDSQHGDGGGGGGGDSNPMFAHLLQQTMAAAADHGAGGDADANDVLSSFQRMFIPSLNSTYADMVAAQQGVSIETLMTQLLQQEDLKSASTSKRFLEALHERELTHRDFIQLYLRFPGTLERDVFPTIATFGTGTKYITQHVEAEEEKKSNAAAAASSSNTAAADDSAASAASATNADDDDEKPAAPPQEHVSSTLVLANPLSGKSPVANAKLFRSKWIVFERGVVSFVDKARLAQDAMARGIIVLQADGADGKEASWPFTASDTTGKGSDIVIPVLMISKADGAVLRDGVQKLKTDEAPRVQILTRERPLACCICRDDYTVGVKAVELPCSHFYCDGCIRPWLEKRSSCPLCRFALPTDAPKLAEDLRGPESNHAQLQRDMFT